MLVRRRAASEVLGAILVAAITMAMSAAYAGYALTQTRIQTASISDALRSSARAQRQLLSLSYYYSDGQGRLHIFMYNMGGEESTLRTVIVGSARYDAPNIEMKDAVTGRSISNCKIAAKQLVEVTVPGQQGQIDLLVLTEEGGIFIWRLNL